MARKKTNHQINNHYDVIIIGGGLAGLSLANLLGSNSISVCCIDGVDPKKTCKESFDGRTVAISWASHKILESAGLWNMLQPDACPIQDIQILDGESPVLLELLSRDVNKSAFGWIVENHLLRRALYKGISEKETITLVAPMSVEDFSVFDDHAEAITKDGQTFSAPLIIGADGRFSKTRDWMNISVREWSYHQQAFVCTVAHTQSHNHIAVEHFNSEGPFAVLPLTDDKSGQHRSSVVWTESSRREQEIKSWSDERFNQELNLRFPDFYGDVHLVSPRSSFPLGLKHAYSYIGERMALVADAAHAMHPIAGQGLNMGFRDIAVISDLIVKAKAMEEDLGSDLLLRSYQTQRRADNTAMMAATDTLNKIFSIKTPPFAFLRKTGIKAVSRFKPAKRFFIKHAMGTAGVLPDLIEH